MTLPTRNTQDRKQKGGKMRVNIYAEELTDRVEVVSKEIDGHTYNAVRFYIAK